MSVNGSDITANAGIQQISGGAGPIVANQSAAACAWTALPNQAALNQGFINGVSPVSVGNTSLGDPTTQGPGAGVDPASGTWYSVDCPATQSITSVWVANPTGGGGATPAVSPVVLAQSAVASMHLATAAIHMSPPAQAEIVNFANWLWIDSNSWRAATATASAGPVSATATATPDRVVWSMGDGHEVVCRGPGVAYDEKIPPDLQHTDCGYTYPHSSAGQPGNRYTVTATVHWHVTWTTTVTGGGGDLGDIAGTAASALVDVGEVQALNIPSP